MALEDRCSPQSAPSPPGIPHSPQSTSSSLILDMSVHSHHGSIQNGLPYAGLGDRQSSPATEIVSYDQQMVLQVPNYDRLSPQSSSDGMAPIKEEESDSIMGDNEQEHEQDATSGEQNVQQPPQIPVISFSITNILSDRFGKKNGCSEKKAPGAIFRPFETTRSSTNNNSQSERSAFTRLTAEAIDYSRGTVANSTAAMLVERANFLNCFNPVAYPRIHEEILNSTRKFKLHGGDVKVPPLGSLCKTVSQIGQPSPGMCMSSPPPTSSLSSASSTSGASSCRVPTSPQPIPPQSGSRDSGMESSDDTRSETGSTKDDNGQNLWPAWVYCTRYSDRPSSGPRYRRPKKPKDKTQTEEKRPRTAFSSEQLARLKREFNENRYLTERRRQHLSAELGLNEAQIKIWFQNKRAKIKKSSGTKNPLALQLMAQGLYNHSTVPLTKEEEELEMRMNGQF